MGLWAVAHLSAEGLLDASPLEEVLARARRRSCSAETIGRPGRPRSFPRISGDAFVSHGAPPHSTGAAEKGVAAPTHQIAGHI